MSEAAEKLEETRENVRQASEALEQNDAAEALTSGRRAEREFEEMRDEFRQQAAGQFNDAVRRMRNEAQELDQKEEELAEQLRDAEQAGGLGLDFGQAKSEPMCRSNWRSRENGSLTCWSRCRKRWKRPRRQNRCWRRSSTTPIRRTQQRQVDRQLKDTGELLRRGFQPEAREMERMAGEGIDQLREELEEAATSVLGDETKALERALNDLERLERDLNEEIRTQQSASRLNNRKGSNRTRAAAARPAAGPATAAGQQPGRSATARQANNSSRGTQQQEGQQQGQQQEGQQPGQQQQQDQQQQGQQQQGQGQQPGQQPGQQQGQQPGQQQPGQQQPGQQQQGQQQPVNSNRANSNRANSRINLVARISRADFSIDMQPRIPPMPR